LEDEFLRVRGLGRDDVVPDGGAVVGGVLGEDDGRAALDTVVIGVAVVVCAGYRRDSGDDAGQDAEELEVQIAIFCRM
jgi:hypothetical protein